MASQAVVLLGIKGSVIALDRRTGQEAWRTKLKGSGFVNLAIDPQYIYATTYGEIFCLDASNGRLLWNNPLKGLGYGLATIAGHTITAATPISTLAQKMHDVQAAAASSASTAAT